MAASIALNISPFQGLQAERQHRFGKLWVEAFQMRNGKFQSGKEIF
jgi:hypothetical protein